MEEDRPVEDVASDVGEAVVSSAGADGAVGGSESGERALQHHSPQGPGAFAGDGGLVGDAAHPGHVCLHYFHEGFEGGNLQMVGEDGSTRPVEVEMGCKFRYGSPSG